MAIIEIPLSLREATIDHMLILSWHLLLDVGL
jgi:hypothetical protein